MKFLGMYQTTHGDGRLIGVDSDGNLHMSFVVFDGVEYRPCINTFIKPAELLAERKSK